MIDPLRPPLSVLPQLNEVEEVKLMAGYLQGLELKVGDKIICSLNAVF
jgi:hypothetical protein